MFQNTAYLRLVVDLAENEVGRRFNNILLPSQTDPSPVNPCLQVQL